ncbi:hypothetical protein B0J13DRAFT_15089 [Dactylonectria estremocensis]|uniref:Uncharacterized protein n=1 Tax=Dactylonectria estremocensis TaxID=1079267 RepID=A0A9P9JDM5_9HYPO|nr:hypothetical protein B0J13DRAFT_15089 [Dactylonectria estremocensis]
MFPNSRCSKPPVFVFSSDSFTGKFPKPHSPRSLQASFIQGSKPSSSLSPETGRIPRWACAYTEHTSAAHESQLLVCSPLHCDDMDIGSPVASERLIRKKPFRGSSLLTVVVNPARIQSSASQGYSAKYVSLSSLLSRFVPTGMAQGRRPAGCGCKCRYGWCQGCGHPCLQRCVRTCQLLFHPNCAPTLLSHEEVGSIVTYYVLPCRGVYIEQSN